ncbi:hypothetical protein J2W79_001572 [Methylorubrum extorquens]|nr:hypothetical protein [Methylorubrum extorquens]
MPGPPSKGDNVLVVHALIAEWDISRRTGGQEIGRLVAGSTDLAHSSVGEVEELASRNAEGHRRDL